MSEHQATIEKLLADLTEQTQKIERTYSEGRGAWRNQLNIQLDHTLRAVAAAATKLAEDKGASPGLRGQASQFTQAQTSLAKQSVQAGRHLRALAEGWSCARCEAQAPKVAKLAARPQPGLPVLECRACGADTPVTEAGAKAFESHFGHLVKPGWNPETNGFGPL